MRASSLRVALVIALASELGCGARSGLLGEAAPPEALDAGGVPAQDSGPAPGPGPAPQSKIVLFGGRGDAGALADTWEWDGTAWSEKSSPSHPSARFSAWAAPQGGNAVLFGGFATTGSQGADKADTWSWDGTAWIEASRVTPPSPRDSATGGSVGATAVLFGGYSYGQVFGDTWAWSGGAWNRLGSSGPAPSGRWAAAAAPLGASLVLFGGRDAATNLNVADTWTFDGTSWSLATEQGPSARLSHAMAVQGGEVVLFGGFENTDQGSAPLGDTWTWDGKRWTARSVKGPSARSSHVMAPLRDKVVLFGGVDAQGSYSGETWIWDGASWSLATGSGPSARADAAMVGY